MNDIRNEVGEDCCAPTQPVFGCKNGELLRGQYVSNQY